MSICIPVKKQDEATCVHAIDLAGATDGEGMATTEGTKRPEYFNVAGAADGEGVATKEETISSQYFNMASAVDVGGMEIEEGAISSQCFKMAGPAHGERVATRKERSGYSFSDV
ncbi:hypothetical protein V502_06842 [Pseudogymnoascus sp. VKM F-4520 (FW-2644)]|nr:hypothetical protein V502_06842 [Pseudogymnoascus sp. VKM F-4520 (FW-2644)]